MAVHDEIMPCPCCQFDAKFIVTNDEKSLGFLKCLSCGMRTGGKKTLAEAIKIWNPRFRHVKRPEAVAVDLLTIKAKPKTYQYLAAVESSNHSAWSAVERERSEKHRIFLTLQQFLYRVSTSVTRKNDNQQNKRPLGIRRHLHEMQSGVDTVRQFMATRATSEDNA